MIYRYCPSRDKMTPFVMFILRSSLVIALSFILMASWYQGRFSISHSALTLPPYDAEMQVLAGAPLIDIPSLQEIQDFVATGIPKGIDDSPRATKSHMKLEAWGRDALTKAFLAATQNDPDKKRFFASQVREIMLIWSSYGTNFGDFVNQSYDYGNINIELVWFMGNLIRAADIVITMSEDPKSNIHGVISQQDKSQFIQWMQVLESRYMNAWVFPSGKSNRKASQIEVLLRSASLRRDTTEIQRLIRTIFPKFINLSIDEHGIIPEDTRRDKYHPQFFLASALQSLEIGKRYGIYLNPKNPEEKSAIDRLASALAYAATSNMAPVAPKGFEAMSDTNPNYEIPFWYLAPRFYGDYHQPVPSNVNKMLQLNYAETDRFDFVMMWGFNAVATFKGL